MNYYQPQRKLSDILPQDEEGLARLLYMNEEPDQRHMMLAQANPNQLQRMVGVQGDGVSSQTKAGIEKALPGFYGNPSPAQVETGYSLGKSTPEEIMLRERQRAAAAVKLGLPPTATDAQIRDAQMKINAKKTASPGTR